MFGPRWAGHRFATFELPQWLPDWWGFFGLDYCAEKIGNKNMKLEKINLLANKMFLDLLKTKRGMSRFEVLKAVFTTNFSRSLSFASSLFSS